MPLQHTKYSCTQNKSSTGNIFHNTLETKYAMKMDIPPLSEKVETPRLTTMSENKRNYTHLAYLTSNTTAM